MGLGLRVGVGVRVGVRVRVRLLHAFLQLKDLAELRQHVLKPRCVEALRREVRVRIRVGLG